MWMGDFPHRKKGWVQVRKQYNKIIFGTLIHPKFLGMHIFKNIEGTLRQLMQIYVGDGFFQSDSSQPPYGEINKYFHHQIKEFRTSVQSTEHLPTAQANLFITLFTVIIGITTLWTWTIGKQEESIASSNWTSIFGIVIAFIVLNAAVTSTFSTVIARLQSRVFWVLPTICLLYVIHHYYILQESQKKKAIRGPKQY
jgi:hypothetical protein